MSEKVIAASRTLICDLCGQRIHEGSRCRMIRDDFMPGLVYFEHITCPADPSAADTGSGPNKKTAGGSRPMPELA